jgi:hypothetical protein
MIKPDKRILTIEDRESPLWRRLADHMRAELARLRETNDAHQLGEVKTAAIRGQITQLKALLALADPDPKGEPQQWSNAGHE